MKQILRQLFTSAVVLIAVSTAASCATAPSHEGFVRFLSASVGISVDTDPFGNLCSVKGPSLVEIIRLPNGNEEHKHIRRPIRGVGACPYSCEVEPKTHTVVAVRIDGSDKDCVQFP